MRKSEIEIKVNQLLDKIRPYVQMHGGDVQFHNLTKNTLTLKVYGACVGCPLADMTYNKMIGGIIRQELPQIKKVTIT